MKGSIDSIESFGLVDGPGIRTVVFFSGCRLRCKYCHNPEMWVKKEPNYTPEELVDRIVRNKPYFKRNQGGVTFSGGEPLLQVDFLIEVCKLLKEENIHIALDTAGVGVGKYEELLSYVDLVLLDIKHIEKEKYQDLTGQPMEESLKFIDALNRSGKKVWIRQVIVPGLMDNKEYQDGLLDYLRTIKNIERIEFLPYHTMGKEKYHKLNIPYPYDEMEAMDKEVCAQMEKEFIEKWKERQEKGI